MTQVNSAVQLLDPLAFPLSGSRLIEASAGTGKTYTIALLYLRLVLGHRDDGTLDVGLTPPDILVVTFTEAAVKELRDRIRRRLVEGVACFSAATDGELSAASSDPLLAALRDSIAPEHWPACIRKLQLAADWMDEAAVDTIHAWCNRMLGEHAFDSRSFFAQTLIKDESEHLREAVRDYWRSFVYPLSAAQLSLFRKSWQDPGDLLKSVRNQLSSGIGSGAGEHDAAAVLDEVARTRAAALATAKAPWPLWLAGLRKLFDQAKSAKLIDGRKIRLASVTTWFEKIEAWSQDSELLEPDLSDAAYDRLRPAGLEGGFKGTHKVLDDLSRHPAWRALAELKSSAWLPDGRSALLQHASAWIGSRLAETKQRRGEISFDDMLRQLDTALRQPGGENLAAVIRRQFPVAMIDEFQDTDPLQYRIFETIYGIEQASDPAEADEVGHHRGIFLIGDPKQAIYAFRNADIYTYLAARSATSPRHYSLHTNYRSSTAMVAAVNHLFSRADEALTRGAFMFTSNTDNPLPFVAVEAHANALALEIEGQSAPALTFWQLAQQSPDGANKPLSKTRYIEELSERCATAIVDLLQRSASGRVCFREGSALKPVQAGDIAILVNNKTESRGILTALQRRGLACVYLSDDSSVLEAGVAREILIWLRACAEPGRLSLVRAALGTQTLAQPDSYLAALTLDETLLESEIDRFRRFNQIWSSQGVLPMLRALMHEFDIAARLLTADAEAVGERRLTDLLHIAEVLQQEAAALDGQHALIRHYSDMINAAADASSVDQLKIRLESDADIIQVVTIHKSKGLEYPLVFLPFAINARPAKLSDTLKWHDEHGVLHVGDGSTGDLLKADDERLAEDIRKLYVALTRARFATWVGVAETEKWRASALAYLLGAAGEAEKTGATSVDDELKMRLTALVAALPPANTSPVGHCAAAMVLQDAPPAEELRYHAPAQPDPGAALQVLRPAAEHWWIASFSALASGLPTPESSREATASDEEHRVPTSDESSTLSSTVPSAGLQLQHEADSWQALAHSFERGAAAGVFLHGMLEWMAGHGFAAFAPATLQARAALRDMLARRCQLRGWTQHIDGLLEWLLAIAAVPLLNEVPLPAEIASQKDLLAKDPLASVPIFSTPDLFADEDAVANVPDDLCDGGEAAGTARPSMAASSALAAAGMYRPELEFWFEARAVQTAAVDELLVSGILPDEPRPALSPSTANGMLKGFIDLVFEHRGRYYVLDYKSNWLGESTAAYTQTAMAAAVLGKRYDLQLALYLLALHRLLRLRVRGYDYDTHVGGAIFMFLRGIEAETHGVFREKPPAAFIEQLDRLFCADASPNRDAS